MYKKGDIVQLIHNVVVEEEYSKDNEHLYVRDINRGIEFHIKGGTIIDTVFSADNFNSTEKIGKTAIAEKLIHSNGKVFTVSFDKSNGETRVLRGIFEANEPLLGRSYVHDLDKDDNNLRLVDHRTINWIIIDSVKYTRN